MHFSNKCICCRPAIIIFHSIRGLNQRKIRIQLIPLSGYLIYLDITLFCVMLLFLVFGKLSIFLSLFTFISCEHLYFQLSTESKWSLSPEGGSIKRTKCGVKYMPVSYIFIHFISEKWGVVLYTKYRVWTLTCCAVACHQR